MANRDNQQDGSEVRVPDIGDFSDVDVIDVLVSPGDRVEAEQPLITLETDKAAMDVPSPRGGVVEKVHVSAGDKVSEGDPVLTFGEAGEAGEAEPAQSGEAADGSGVRSTGGGGERGGPSAAGGGGEADERRAPGGARGDGEEQAAGGARADDEAPDRAGAGGEDAGRAGGAEVRSAEEDEGGAGQLVTVPVPDIGDFSDVSVVDVLVAAGDEIEEEAPLITLETDKAAMDVPSPQAGVVEEVLVTTESTVSEGDPVVRLRVRGGAAGQASEPAPGEGDEEDGAGTEAARTPSAEDSAGQAGGEGAAAGRPAARRPEAARSGPAPIPPQRDRESAGARAPGGTPATAATPTIDEAGFSRAHAGPSVRRFARELGADLSRIEGSGLKGRITADDVKAHVKAFMTGAAAAAPSLPQVPQVDFAKFGPVEERPLSRIQKISGPRLHASWVNVPHVTQFDSADITDLENTRQQLKPVASDQGVKLTPLAFLVCACARMLEEFELFRAALDAEAGSLIVRQYTHIGFAADTPNGLVVPVIRDADRKDLFAVARELAELAEAAREGKLKADQMQGGVFTISSLGGIGGTAFTPIVNAPEVAILGVSRSTMTPVWDGEQFVPRLMLPLSLSYDHRVIDGAAAVRFTTRLCQVLADVDALLPEGLRS